MCKHCENRYVTVEEFRKTSRMDLRMHGMILLGAAVFGLLELAKAWISFH